MVSDKLLVAPEGNITYMAKYRNPRIEAEMNEDLEQELEQDILNEPATSVDEEVFKKRYADLRRYQSQKEKEAAEREEALKKQLNAALTGQIKMPKSEEEVEEWTKQYPEFRAILDTIIQREIKETVKVDREKISKFEERQAEIARREAILEIKRRHPDAENLFKKDSDFHKWLGKQSKRDQDAIYTSLDVDDADFVIGKFKTQNGKRPSKVEEDEDFSDAAKVVRPSSGGNVPDSLAGDYDYSESQVEREGKKDKNWYDKHEEKIMAAIRKGRFNYDISGGAR